MKKSRRINQNRHMNESRQINKSRDITQIGKFATRLIISGGALLGIVDRVFGRF